MALANCQRLVVENDAASFRPKRASFICHVRAFVQTNGVIGNWRVRHSPTGWRVTARRPPARSDMRCPTCSAFGFVPLCPRSAMGIGVRWHRDPPSATRKSCAAAGGGLPSTDWRNADVGGSCRDHLPMVAHLDCGPLMPARRVGGSAGGASFADRYEGLEGKAFP
jgi:hypothetical protein